MSVNHSTPVCLHYGSGRRLSCEIAPGRLIAWHEAPAPLPDPAETVRKSLQSPLEFPPLTDVFYPGDRIVLALDRSTPEAATVVAEVWRVCEQRSIRPEDVCVLQPAALRGGPLPDPRDQLADGIAQAVRWKVHDPADRAGQVYLASTSLGERVYLAREIVDADVVVLIGAIAFDSVLGYRGTGSVIYPGLSTVDAMRKAHGQGHRELGPDDIRPLRQLIDEITWLLGVQFAIQVIAGDGPRASHVLAGAVDAVYRRGQELLKAAWHVQVHERPDVVVLAVDADAGGHGWEQVGAALQTARNLVAAGGKIVVLSDLQDELDDGLQIVRDAEEPVEALKPLRLRTPPDLIPATQLIQAVDWAKVYFLSRLAPDVVEDLFMTPLDDVAEVHRLLEGDATCALLAAAQHTYGSVRERTGTSGPA